MGTGHRVRKRSLQIASNIQRELQNRLARGLADPRIKGLITVTRVELSDDLKHAKAFISVMPDKHAKVTMHGLTSATGRLRKDVMDRIHLKEMPTLKLLYDEGLKAQMEVMALLEKDRIEKDRMGNSLQEKTAGTEPASSDEETPQG
ncbi:MAG: ribosome-binding factor A [Phycisphaerae bacterium]|nr:ribosome-binding factor A [Phycisphaerae bacterium]MBM93103.1 ribosome-binding factor A [Phycisphaerae bacterium]